MCGFNVKVTCVVFKHVFSRSVNLQFWVVDKKKTKKVIIMITYEQINKTSRHI